MFVYKLTQNKQPAEHFSLGPGLNPKLFPYMLLTLMVYIICLTTKSKMKTRLNAPEIHVTLCFVPWLRCYHVLFDAMNSNTKTDDTVHLIADKYNGYDSCYYYYTVDMMSIILRQCMITIIVSIKIWIWLLYWPLCIHLNIITFEYYQQQITQ